MSSSNSGFTLEENLVLSNEELTSNVSKLASFIRSYERGTWEVARAKASKLLKGKKAIEYIEEVRATLSGTAKPPVEPAVQAPTKVSKPIIEQTIYEKNYDRLMAIAPGLEDKLENYKDDYIYGKSVKTGYMDFNLEVLDRDKTGFYIAISHYYLQNGDMVADPDMEIFVNIKKKTIEALHFQDALRYIEVYPDKRNRDVFSRHQRKDQNDFLADWLKNLKNQGHKIKWDEEETTGIAPTVPPSSPSSIIVDKYKKADKVEQSTELKVEKTEKPTEPKATKEDEKKEEPPIISLFKSNKEELVKSLEKFVMIVAFRENGVHVQDMQDLNERIKHILDHQGATDYLIKAWEDLQKEDHARLKKLNYHRFYSILPEIIEVLNNEAESVRLVSEKSKEAFRIILGDDRNKKAPVLGIYQLNGKENEPTLLVRLDESKEQLSVDMALNRFFDMLTFDSSEKFKSDLEPYQASLGLEKWLDFLYENEYKPIQVDLKKVEENSPSKSESVEEQDEFDNDYINKDIPDFEPGHVQLTETHKKYGVTQKVINEINRTLKGKVIIARAKAMVHNTKDKLADLAQQAQMPGFRISKTGKFYFEGRSNRADRTRSGY
ncbi:MAG: hypothetical protein A3D31_08325 [Candidatus Fluviicola riflensis]|nr:MAG: hypothetical protein CHH17_06675 [Candidatus Fluviicola riflensis]OGS79945.1 MAG: hypothetical protein A3D31_08325 [Candidatus Fluviicola riflensis]OGS82460.1 MAG: hypothetical protein A2724_17270 [Fluviicola sp. RIFCSPHIGHO2_01_FULL_43_53]OGS88124.1 MAG: hypothetical protein A3E30_14705 [Fluviicola sp. RIFCSPHIGHO2_12_FULL_43_24]